jgi:hypothetical protein
VAIMRGTDRVDRPIDHETAVSVWEVLNGEREGNADQQAYCENVEKLFISWRHAPDSYIESRRDMILEFAVSGWMRNRNGDFTKPEANDTLAWEFARKWGLWDHGRTSQAIAISDKLNNHGETRHDETPPTRLPFVDD